MTRLIPNKRMASAKAALLGFHGQRNTGDDALACSISWGLYRHQGVRHYIIPAEPRHLPVLPGELQATTPLPWLCRGRFRTDWRWKLSIQRSEIVLIAGGAFLHEMDDFDHLKKLAGLARSSGSRAFGAIGLSLGPFKTQQKIDECGEFLSMLDFLTVRDHTSYELASAYSLPYSPVEALDAVLTLPAVYGISTTPKTTLKNDVLDIGVSICDYHPLVGDPESDPRRCRAKIAESLIAFSRDHKVRVTVFEFSGHRTRGDREIVNDIASALEGQCEVTIHHYALDPSIMWRKVAEMDMVIAMRFHSQIFSYAAGVPFVMMDYHPKCAALANDIGLPGELVLSPYDFTPEDLQSRLELLIDPNRPLPAVQWREAADRAELNFGPLDAIL